MARYLQEHLTFSQAQVKLLSEDAPDGSGKTLYMEGICIEGDKRNANDRIYPAHEIRKAVGTINEQLKSGNSVLGEVDHPDDLKINLDRVSHMIDKMWCDGAIGYGKLKIENSTHASWVWKTSVPHAGSPDPLYQDNFQLIVHNHGPRQPHIV